MGPGALPEHFAKGFFMRFAEITCPNRAALGRGLCANRDRSKSTVTLVAFLLLAVPRRKEEGQPRGEHWIGCKISGLTPELSCPVLHLPLALFLSGKWDQMCSPSSQGLYRPCCFLREQNPSQFLSTRANPIPVQQEPLLCHFRQHQIEFQ